MRDAAPTYAEVNEYTLAPLAPPREVYVFVMAALALLIGWAGLCWMYQVESGMGVTGVSHPVGWAVYIANFVFWVGIAHSGTLISAILYLVRSHWRTAVSRSAEAMTVFAVMTAGLFPLVHLGRLWVFYFILPYPSQRQLWPNFISPLVWDVVAVGTYFTVSVIFFYVGLLPDLAAARDRCWEDSPGLAGWRSRFYRYVSLGWTGSGRQWQHSRRSYLFFAALATPLVVSVHSVVSWDFAMSLLPGWHTTIFAPYFVAGAIHSGLAMVLALLIPMRRLFRLERLITIDHFESVAQTMLVTTLIVGYAYVIEPFIAWYSGDLYERQFAAWRAVGWMAPFYWSLFGLNVFAPLLFVFRSVRRRIASLFVIAILVNLGMWLERFVIVIGSTSHDFLPHNWGPYAPTWVEISITVGSFGFFIFFFLLFAKFLPTVAISDVKEELERKKKGREPEPDYPRNKKGPDPLGSGGVLTSFNEPERIAAAVKLMHEFGVKRLETYSPRHLREVEPLLGRGRSPVRYWAFAGAVLGCIGGFALAILSAKVNGLIVGGKHPVSIIPYCIIAFEGTVLIGTLANFAGLLFHARLGLPGLPEQYRRSFSRDAYGLFVSCTPEDSGAVINVLQPTNPEEIHEIR